MSKIWEIYPYFNEAMLAEIRLGELKSSHVVVIEGNQTFSGQPKDFTFPFADLPQVTYIQVKEYPETDNPWDREQFQENYALQFLDIADDDVVVCSDCDEIPRWSSVLSLAGKLSEEVAGFRLGMGHHKYKFNLLDEGTPWNKAAICTGKLFKERNFTGVRGWIELPIVPDCGWHLYGMEDFEAKARASSHYRDKETIAMLERLKKGASLLEEERSRLAFYPLSKLPKSCGRYPSFFEEEAFSEPSVSEKLTIQLGRAGDILAILPLLYSEYVKSGQKQRLMVAQEYASVLDGASYVEPVIFPGKFDELDKAIASVKGATISQVVGKRDVIVSQVYGKDIKIGTDSFEREMWNVCGKLSEWKFNHPLVFDRRDTERESYLPKLGKKNKTILVASSGHSSPFQHRELLWEMLWMRFGRNYNVVDISDLKAERIYDLLGLYEKADCLVATDSAPLHLAVACNIPVVALIADTPTRWHGSAYKPNHIAHIRYSDFPKYAVSMLKKIADLGVPGSPFNPTLVNKNRLIHVWNHSDMSEDAKRRHLVARQTWDVLYSGNQWIENEVAEGMLSRSSKLLNDEREVPFLKDIIRLGSLRAKDGDIIVLTNSDTCLPENLSERIVEACKSGCAYSYRRDFDKILSPYSLNAISRGRHYPGSDLFCFTRAWWWENMSKIPDFLIACEGWDKVLRELMKKTGGNEIPNGCYHEHHDSLWQKKGFRENNVGNRHNRKLATEWLTKNGLPLEELSSLPI